MLRALPGGATASTTGGMHPSFIVICSGGGGKAQWAGR